ncbi:MAG: aldehyde ferredoxin oxidoreductase [Anaerolineae bacterium]|jgi:aldehyde:ferredoxin oxidoreductase|nr:aldehyde ferredoxin oxidoreductase [Anaerolineae bacterium]MBT3714766.1 aldehyde ferredoxin oxidoreductase [Anaerolineae bacterium]MBT4309521.1 aldehyde ferredoxin oxidoreductase [Anaerolineae bacterium]MBT4457297.1 aldehyde ferredoxin oxidoreductase [Anaerolineae bacterium]MBT4842996.1 aldehyde ferredoxin oxidoreductase [Anaerolineae bacterium]
MAKQILRINMSDLSATYEDVPEKWAKWAGRGLTSLIVADEVDPTCHPLGPNNKLAIAPGWVSGSPAAPSSGRTSFGAKSPLTGGIKEANSGGLSSQKIAKLGLAAIIIEGMPADGKFYEIFVNKDGVKFEDAADLLGKGMYETADLMWEKYDNKPAVIGVGPVGERKLSNAGISVNDPENSPGRYAGRGGLGAVMGARGVKVMIVDDKGGPGVEIADMDLFKTARKKVADAMGEHALTKVEGGLWQFGTNVLMNIINEAGGLPTRNFSAGQFEGAAKISGEAVKENIEIRGGVGKYHHACHPGCIMQCSSIYPNTDGSKFVSVIEYETSWALGANCGIDDLEYIAQATWECNDIGLDTIEAGNTIAIAMDGGYLEFGDTEGALKLFDEMRDGTPLGRVLGQGVEATAKAFGVYRVPTVKGQSMPAYEPRAIKGIGVTYATTVMGADHTAGYTIAPEIAGVGGKVDPLDNADKGDLSLTFQAATAFIDSTGYCLFIAFPILDIPEGWAGMAESVAGVTGIEMTGDDVIAIGKEVLKIERLFNEAAGFTPADDRLPEFMRDEALPPHNVKWDMEDEVLDKVFDWVHD